MYLDATKNLLHIATDDHEIVKSVLELFNRVYKTRMVYKESTHVEGVLFSYVDVGNASIDEIFLFGVAYGTKIQYMTDRKDING